jgi:hypothetical protein
MCHLAWHHRLRDEDLPADYQWGESGLDPINRVFMAAYVSLLPQNASVVPYGITTYGPCFDEQGRYVDQPLGFGLTCATFILDVYARRGFNLLREDQWPERADDALWQRLIIEALTTSGASAQHVEAMREHVGAPRFRPEEVAAGCISEEIPISFDDALTLAQEILQDLQTAAS